MFVRTERLFLRPAWPEDLDDLVEVLGEDATQRTAGALPLPRTAAEMRAYIDRPRDPRLPHFVMYLRAPEGPQLVGGIGLARHEGGAGDGDGVEVGYWIAAFHKGRGFASEALRAVVGHARVLGYKRVIANHPASHPGDHPEAQKAEARRTQQVLEGAGFRATGKVRARHGPLRAMEPAPVRAMVHIYVAELERRAGPKLEMAGAGGVPSPA